MPVIPHLRHDAAFFSNKIIDYFPSILGMNVGLFSKNSSEYSAVELYIDGKLKKKYSADVQYSLPYLFSLNCHRHISAAVGVSAAESGPLYLEKYLQHPVEQEIGIYFKTAIRRESIVEVGNVISGWRGNNQLLFILLFDLLIRSDREWLLLFSNKEIEPVLKKVNFITAPLSDASVKILDGEKKQWGSYFHDDPRIMFCHIPSAMAILTEKIFMNFASSLFSNRLPELANQWKQKSE